MVKRFSKKHGNKGRAFNYLQSESYVKMPVSDDASSLHHCPQIHCQYFTILRSIQAFDNKRPVERDLILLSIQQLLCFSRLFQLHRGQSVIY